MRQNSNDGILYDTYMTKVDTIKELKTLKECRVCNKILSIDDFTTTSNGIKSNRCKLCTNEYHRSLRKKIKFSDRTGNKICSSCNKLLPKLNFNPLKSICKDCERNYDANRRVRRWARKTLADHKKNGYEILITVDTLEDIAESTKICKWCGVDLQWEYGKGTVVNSPSLDRIDNESTITVDNIEIICRTCNLAKSNRTKLEFKEHIKRMYEVSVLGC